MVILRISCGGCRGASVARFMPQVWRCALPRPLEGSGRAPELRVWRRDEWIRVRGGRGAIRRAAPRHADRRVGKRRRAPPSPAEPPQRRLPVLYRRGGRPPTPPPAGGSPPPARAPPPASRRAPRPPPRFPSPPRGVGGGG